MTFSNNIAGSDERTVDKVHGIVRKMVETDVIKKERIDQSYKRIMRMKALLQTDDKRAYVNQELQQTQAELQQANAALAEYKSVIDKARKKNEKRNRKKKS